MNKTVVFNPVFTNKAKERLLPYSIVPNWAKNLPEPLQKLLFSQIGAAGAWTLTNVGRTKLIDGSFDIDSDTWKMALHLSTGTQPSATITNWSELDTSEHANANGYTDGGLSITLSLSGTTTVMVDGTNPQWTASGGSIVARWAVIYEVGGAVLCYCLLDSTPADVTATDGNTLTVEIHASGVFTLA